MTRYYAYLEEDADGTCLAHVPDLAGCAAAGSSRAGALVALPRAIRTYLDWCAAHGDPVVQDGVIDLQVAEIVSGCRPWQRGGANALFSVDRAPLGDAELRTYLRRMNYAHTDLLAIVRDLSPDALDTPTADGAPTLRETLAHLVVSEQWYLSRLGLRAPAIEARLDIHSWLIDARARAVELILRLAPRQRDLVCVPTQHRSENPEEGWTLRKVLRRFLEHELAHLDEIHLRIAASSPSVSRRAAH